MRLQAQVATLQNRRFKWVEACGGPHTPFDKLSRGLRIGIISGGPVGATTAFEAVKASAQVTLIEARHEVGGRTRSVELGCRNMAEQECMRFPPSATAQFVVAKAFGFGFIEGFPSPATFPTLLSHGCQYHLWTDAEARQESKRSWLTLLSRREVRSMASRSSLALLQSPQVEVRMQAVNIWLAYISEFQCDTFSQGVRKNLWVHTRDSASRQALDQGRLWPRASWCVL